MGAVKNESKKPIEQCVNIEKIEETVCDEAAGVWNSDG